MDKAGEILKKLPVFKNIDGKKAAEYTGMFGSWESIAGRKLADYSRIADLKRNTLVIEVDHPAIMQLIQFKYGEILSKIRRKYPDLEIGDMRMYIRNPDYKEGYSDKNRVNSFAGDDDKGNVEEKREVDLKSIENGEFRDLLLNMKKRSQV